jgi:hypothetical protein
LKKKKKRQDVYFAQSRNSNLKAQCLPEDKWLRIFFFLMWGQPLASGSGSEWEWHPGEAH